MIFSPRAGEVDESHVDLEEGATVTHAVAASGLAARHQAADILQLSVGVWGRRCEPSRLLKDGDRVEVYRPLLVDPKEARRLRYRVASKQPKGRAGA